MLLLEISDATTGDLYVMLYLIIAAIVGTGTMIYWLVMLIAWIFHRNKKL